MEKTPKKPRIRFWEFTKLGRIKSLDDFRLMYIDPTENGFYDLVCNFVTDNHEVQDFLTAVKYVKEQNVEPFWRPIYDPCIDSVNNEVCFKPYEQPAVGFSFSDWQNMAAKMPDVEGKRWRSGNELEYIIFLVLFINRLVKSGRDIHNAINAVLINSTELGHYSDSKNGILLGNEKTGMRGVCGFYDLANTFKLLACSNAETEGFWRVGGCHVNDGHYKTLAYMVHYPCIDQKYDNGVGWLVLS